MFFCGKWISSGGRLEEPWIEGHFHGMKPDYVKCNRDFNVQSVSNDLLEVVKSKSKNLKHRISLRLSSELSYGVCFMYEKKVKQLFDDCTMKKLDEADEFENYDPSSDFISDSESDTSFSESQARSHTGSDDRMNEYEDVRNHETSPEFSIQSTDKRNLEMSPESCLQCTSVRSLQTSSETSVRSTELEEESEITVIKCPNVTKSPEIEQLVVEDLHSHEMEATTIENTIQFDTNNTLTTHNKPYDCHDLKEDSQIIGLKPNPFSVEKCLSEKSSSPMQRSLAISDSNNRNKRPASDSLVTEEERTPNVSKRRLTDFQCLKIQDSYENFTSQWKPEDILDSEKVINRRKRHFVKSDSKTLLCERYMRGNIRNPQCHTKPETNSKNKFDIKLQNATFLLKNPGICDRCIVRRKYWMRNLLTRRVPCDKNMFLQEEATEVCRLESRRKDNEEEIDSINEMPHITCKRPRVSLGDISSHTISSSDASPKGAIEMQSVENISNVLTNFKSRVDSELARSLSDSVLCVNRMPSLPSSHHLDESDQSYSPKSLHTAENEIMLSSEEHDGVVNIILPMHLKNRLNPQEIKVVIGSMGTCNDIKIETHSDIESDDSSCHVFSPPAVFNRKLRKEWNENGVYKKLIRLWRHVNTVTPKKLFEQGSHCGNVHMARARMFHSILGLKSKGIIICTKDISGQTKCILKGPIMKKLTFNLSD